MKIKLIINSILLLVLSGCISLKKVNNAETFNSTDIITKSTIEGLKSPIKASFVGNFSTDKNVKISGYYKIYDNNKFQILIYSKTLGIELGRVQYYNDTITLIDKINKNIYRSKDFSKVSPVKMQLNVSDILSFFIGSLLNSYDNTTYNREINRINYNLSFYEGFAWFDNEGYLIKNELKNSNASFESNYSNFSRKYRLPQSISGILVFNNSNIKYQLKILGFQKIKVSEFKQFNLNSNYKVYNE